MKRDEYFRYLQETSEIISPIILKYVEPTHKFDKEFYDNLMLFINRRINKPLLKPTLLRLSYEVCGGQNWGKVVYAAAAFEFINISSYQANSAFDNKLGIIDKSQKDSQFISSMITREISLQIVSELKKDFDENTLNEIYNSLSKSNYNIYLAQHYDLNVLNIKNYDNYQNEQLFLKDYINRCFYGSGIFTGQCAYIGGLLAKAPQEQLNALKEFGEQYGTALHIINDLGDFVPSDANELINGDYKDQYSDFKNGRLTLPLYHLLRFGSSQTAIKIKDILNKKCFDKESLLEVTQLLLKEGTVSYVKEKARELFGKAKKQLIIFKKSENKQLLLIMTSILLTNKYLVALRAMKQEV